MAKPTSDKMVEVVNGKIGKMVKPVGGRKWYNVKKPTGPKIDAEYKIAKPLSAIKW